MTADSPPPLGLAALWLAATVGVVTLAVVVGLARIGTPTNDWGDRVATTALVGTIDIARAATAPATHHAMATGV